MTRSHPKPSGPWATPASSCEAMGRAWRWMVTNAPTERAFLEAFFVWVYTRRAHLDGTVSQIVEESLAFPHAASADAIQTHPRRLPCA